MAMANIIATKREYNDKFAMMQIYSSICTRILRLAIVSLWGKRQWKNEDNHNQIVINSFIFYFQGFIWKILKNQMYRQKPSIGS